MHLTDWLPISDTKAPQIIKTRLLREGAARTQAETVNGTDFNPVSWSVDQRARRGGSYFKGS